MSEKYASTGPTRAEVDLQDGPAIVEFGVPWCGYCQAAETFLAAALTDHPGVRHLRIEDGKGRPLGRSFGVTLWPTFVFLNCGKEIARLVRPRDANAIRQALALIDV
jgi:thioredoxin 1